MCRIADTLDIVEHTVRIHKDLIMRKLALDSIAKLVHPAEKSLTFPHAIDSPSSEVFAESVHYGTGDHIIMDHCRPGLTGCGLFDDQVKAHKAELESGGHIP